MAICKPNPYVNRFEADLDQVTKANLRPILQELDFVVCHEISLFTSKYNIKIFSKEIK